LKQQKITGMNAVEAMWPNQSDEEALKKASKK
jgi:hypothetical protein